MPVGETSVSLSAHQEQLAKSIHKRVVIADETEVSNNNPFPMEIAFIWEVFVKLNIARGSNGFSPCTISYTELAAWCYLTQTQLDPWEVDLIRTLDNLWLKVWNGRPSGTQPQSR